jgi:hypothetical protein
MQTQTQDECEGLRELKHRSPENSLLLRVLQTELCESLRWERLLYYF